MQLDTKIRLTELSTRAKNVIEGCGIDTVGDLIRWRQDEIIQMNRCGKATLKEIEGFLKKNELSLQMEA